MLMFFGHDPPHPSAVQLADERLVGENVERLLGDAVLGWADVRIQLAGQRSAAYALCDPDRGLRQGDQNARYVGAGVPFEESGQIVVGSGHFIHERLPASPGAGNQSATAASNTGPYQTKETDLFFGQP